MSDFVTVFNSSGDIEDWHIMCREAPLSMMRSRSPTEVVGREMLPLPGYHVDDDKRTSTGRLEKSLSF